MSYGNKQRGNHEYEVYHEVVELLQIIEEIGDWVQALLQFRSVG